MIMKKQYIKPLFKVDPADLGQYMLVESVTDIKTDGLTDDPEDPEEILHKEEEPQNIWDAW